MPDPNATIQPDATATAPQIETRNSPITGELRPPAVAPVQAPVAAPAVPNVPPITTTSSNPHMHSFISRVLGAFAGPPPVAYTTTPEGKVIPAANQRPDRNVDRVGRIVQHALVGLSAPTPPGRPSVLAGIGAGAGAVRKELSAEDQAAQTRAKEDWEAEQQTKLRQVEIARANAQNFQLHFQNLKMQNDLDAVRAQSKEIADAFRTMPDHGVREMAASAAEAAIKDPNNPTWLHTHLVLPAGFQDVADEAGNPVKDAQGNFRTEGRVYVIDGMKDGKVPIPASIASDVQKYKDYGDLARIPGLDGIKAGDEYDVSGFVRLYNALLSSKVAVEKGWTLAEVSEDKDGKVIQRNPVNSEMRPATPSQTQKFQMDKANLGEKQQQIRTGKSTEIKNLAEAEKARKDTASEGPVSNLTGEAYLKSLPVGEQNTVRAIGEGRQVLSMGMLRTKDGQALAKKVNQAYPTFDETRSSAYAKLRQDFTSGREALGINSFNTALSHLGRAYDHVSAASTVPGVRTIAQWLGNQKATAFDADATAVTGEIAKAYKGGVINKEEKEEYEHLLRASTPANVKGNIRELAELLTGKLQAYQSQWESGMPSGVIPPFPIINSAGRAAYNKITGQPQLPAGALHQGKAADGTTVFQMQDGSVQDGSGNKYDPQTGQRVQ